MTKLDLLLQFKMNPKKLDSLQILLGKKWKNWRIFKKNFMKLISITMSLKCLPQQCLNSSKTLSRLEVLRRHFLGIMKKNSTYLVSIWDTFVDGLFGHFIFQSPYIRYYFGWKWQWTSVSSITLQSFDQGRFGNWLNIISR